MQTANAYKVLVVEDEGLIAHDIATRLEALGHQVVATVATADEAVEQAAGADVVLMDIRIDGQRDGIAAAHEVRARHHVPVVFLTVHSDRSTLERAKAAGPFGYIVKPLELYRHLGQKEKCNASLDEIAHSISSIARRK